MGHLLLLCLQVAGQLAVPHVPVVPFVVQRVSARPQPLAWGSQSSNLQLHPEPPVLSGSLSTWHELILLSPPWDCWAKGLQYSIPDSSAIQLAFPAGQARWHAQVPPPGQPLQLPASRSNIPSPEGSDPTPASPACAQQDLCTPSRGGTCKERVKAKVIVHQGETSMHFSIC